MADALQSIILHYFPLTIVTMEPVPFGLTNTTCFVTVKDKRFVARHYDRYTKSVESLNLEMEVSSFLQQSALSFNIPTFLHTKNGDLSVTLPDGTIGVLVSYIQGTVPALQTTDDARLFGSVVGELSSKLKEYRAPLKYEGIPFTDLYKLHSLADAEGIASFWKCPPFSITDEQRFYYDNALISVEKNMETLMSLPRQLVHHDVLLFNLLSMDNRITGVLDFDFLGVDISFLEFVISLNHVLQMSGGSIELTTAFIEGYAGFRNHSSEELGQIRTLTQLYHIAILHIYIGQCHSGKDTAASFAYIANQLIERDDWLKQNDGILSVLLSPIEQDQINAAI